jgi:hypothetical protein
MSSYQCDWALLQNVRALYAARHGPGRRPASLGLSSGGVATSRSSASSTQTQPCERQDAVLSSQTSSCVRAEDVTQPLKRRRVGCKRPPQNELEIAMHATPEVSSVEDHGQHVAMPASDQPPGPVRWRGRDSARKYAVRTEVFKAAVALNPAGDSLDGRFSMVMEELSNGDGLMHHSNVRSIVSSLKGEQLRAYYERCVAVAAASRQGHDLLHHLAELAVRAGAEYGSVVARPGGLQPTKVQSMLCTFNGPWGLLPASLCFIADRATSRSDGLARLRADPWCLALWTRVREFAEYLASLLRMTSWSCALEVSLPDAGSEEARCVRVHFHLFCCFGTRGAKVDEWLSFDGCAPHFSRPTYAGRAGRGRHSLAMQGQGHYYCLAPKFSSVFSTASDQPRLLCGVRTNWIIALYADGKISADVAVSEVVKYKRDVQRALAAISAAEHAAQEMRLADLVRQVELVDRSFWRPRVHLADVEEVFMRQFEVFRGRRRFLVLTGPSGVGKTDYIRALAADTRIQNRIKETERCQSDQPDKIPAPAHGGGTEVLEVCAHGDGSSLPDVKRLSPVVHGWLLIDEITPVLVINNRRLFQGKAGWTNISGSATNVYAGRVCSWGVRIVGTANDWRERAAALPAADQSWLSENSIVVDVRAPLWHESAPIAHSGGHLCGLRLCLFVLIRGVGGAAVFGNMTWAP